MQRNKHRAPCARLAALATVGGGAGTSLITQRTLRTKFRVPVITTPHSQLNVAAGAALLADGDLAADARRDCHRPPMCRRVSRPRHGLPAPPVSRQASGGRRCPFGDVPRPGVVAGRRAGGEPVPYTGADYSADVFSGPTDARPPMAFAPPKNRSTPTEPPPLPWYKRPPILFGAAAAAALLAIGGSGDHADK